MKTSSDRMVHDALGAGRWFPGSRDELAFTVNACMDAADSVSVSGRIVAAISPHAGYVYSGPTAGVVFRAIRDAALVDAGPDVVVVLGSSHQEMFRGVALLEADTFRTPLGDVSLDRDAAESLVSSGERLSFNNRPHMGEHSAENQVPFVQAALPGTGMVVGLMGDHEPESLTVLGAALERLAVNRSVLVVASSDMLHDADYDLVTRTDRTTLATIEAMDVDSLEQGWGYRNQTLCGIGPVLTAMRFSAAQGCDRGTVLHYCNSGDDHPESRGSWVVGYGAVVFAARP